mmetsp:Transcript_21961/g.34526  ORF Transcript_21961/g.34526 Transcript_21961/m.34526 type:complete len:252 (-) Transcript_21961:672-1427(-)
MISPSNHDEEYDSFLIDPGSLSIVHGSVRAGGGSGRGRDHDGISRASRSAATTQLATEVGSSVGLRKDPRIKSITFFQPKIFVRREGNNEVVEARDDASPNVVGGDRDYNGDQGNGEVEENALTCEISDLTHWDIILKDPPAPGSVPTTTAYRRRGGMLGKLSKVGNNFKRSKAPRLIIEDFEGLVEFSSFEAGDRLVSINKKKIKPAEFSAKDAMALMRECLENEGFLHVTSENPLGEYRSSYLRGGIRL